MAMTAPPVSDRKRVKVYELKDNDWFDRGTGFCTGTLINDEARIHVQSEDEPERTLLETKITRDDGYQKQQDTLIVWTEQNVTDMALSFQEAEGCAAIWEFVSDSQQRLGLLVDDGSSEDIIDPAQFNLPDPDMTNLPDVENITRMANNSGAGREALAKFVLANEYISKLVPLVQTAEDFESIVDLHRLCNIMKTIILLNDNTIIESAVQDDLILGVVGALEYDPDFPAHKANHRAWLSDTSRFKQVVKMDEPKIVQKIHQTYRLQYLKDVVLARIIDDPTFSVLNSLIYFNQIEIVQYVSASIPLLKDLFGIFRDSTGTVEASRKKNAVVFIQQCCSIAKGLQAPARQSLFNNFVTAGLFNVFTYALKHSEAQVRVAGTEILIALIDHDNIFLRSQIFKAVSEKTKPLTDTLIELLLQEPDLGVKSQMADAIKILLDPVLNAQSVDHIGRNNPDLVGKLRHPNMANHGISDFVQNFYDDSAKKLFKPLKDLQNRESMLDLTTAETSLFSHLVEMLCYFLRQHAFRTKGFLLINDLNSSVARLFACPEKFLKLSSLKFFRTCLQMSDNWHHQQIIACKALEPMLDILIESWPKDNLLNSACLELFEFVRKSDHVRELLVHVVDSFRPKVEKLASIETFKAILHKYDNMTASIPDELSFTTVETEQTPSRNGVISNGQRWQGLRDIDPEQEAYFDAEDGDDDEALAEALSPLTSNKSLSNGSSPLKPLVDYPDEEDEEMPTVNGVENHEENKDEDKSAEETAAQVARGQTPPPERLSEKRRREEEEDEDELAQLVSQPKRRSSVGSTTSTISNTSNTSNTSQTLRRKRSMQPKDGGPAGKKISISLAVKPETPVQGSDS